MIIELKKYREIDFISFFFNLSKCSHILRLFRNITTRNSVILSFMPESLKMLDIVLMSRSSCLKTKKCNEEEIETNGNH